MTSTTAQPWIVSAVPADGSAHPYSRMVDATGARSAIHKAGRDAGPWQAGGDLAALFTAATDDEAAAIESAAVRAGLLLKCHECGCGVGSARDLCQACGATLGPGQPEQAEPYASEDRTRVTITLEEIETAPHGQVIVGSIEVTQDRPDEEDASPCAAAVAWNAITRNGVFTVNGKTYSAAECAEWWA